MFSTGIQKRVLNFLQDKKSRAAEKYNADFDLQQLRRRIYLPLAGAAVPKSVHQPVSDARRFREGTRKF